jgi:hypothetical protein
MQMAGSNSRWHVVSSKTSSYPTLSTSSLLKCWSSIAMVRSLCLFAVPTCCPSEPFPWCDVGE